VAVPPELLQAMVIVPAATASPDPSSVTMPVPGWIEMLPAPAVNTPPAKLPARTDAPSALSAKLQPERSASPATVKSGRASKTWLPAPRLTPKVSGVVDPTGGA
jgi:hypothetical protein